MCHQMGEYVIHSCVCYVEADDIVYERKCPLDLKARRSSTKVSAFRQPGACQYERVASQARANPSKSFFKSSGIRFFVIVFIEL